MQTVPTEMTFGVSRDQGAFEWSGTSLSGIFAQPRNFCSLKMWRMIFDIVRFNQYALDLLVYEAESESDPSGGHCAQETSEKPRKQQSIGKYLEANGYSQGFRDDYLIPMTASVWSTSPDKASLDFPAITLIRFMWNHHLLTTVGARPQWMTIPGGSQRYIDAILDGFPEHSLHLSSPVRSIGSMDDGAVQIRLSNGEHARYDHVVLATHGDTASSILQDSASANERDIMAGFQTSENTAILHSDLSLMPKRPIAWSSWNYITTSPDRTNEPNVCLTYCMNILQHISSKEFSNVLVTLNPLHRPAEATIQGEWTYHHPLYNAAAIRSQDLLPSIQNVRNISYAGAWTKYGFHEDGFSSGLKVAIDHLGAKLPFDFQDSTFSRGRRPLLGWRDILLRFCISLIQYLIAFTSAANTTLKLCKTK